MAGCLERLWGKDLSEFNLSEIEKFFALCGRYKGVAQRRIILEKYIEETSSKRDMDNPASTKFIQKEYGLNSMDEWYSQFMSENNDYLTYEEVHEIISKVIENKNSQDALIIKLLFEGLDSDEIKVLAPQNVIGDEIVLTHLSIFQLNFDIY